VPVHHVGPPGGRWPPPSVPDAADMRPLAARRLPFSMRVRRVLPSTAAGSWLPRFPVLVRLPRSSHPLPRPAPPGWSPRRISFAGGCDVVVRRRSGLPPGRVADLLVASQAGCLLSFPSGEQQPERPGVHWSGGEPTACEADVCASRCRSRSEEKVPARPGVMSSFPDQSADGPPDRWVALGRRSANGRSTARPRRGRPSAPARTDHEEPQPAVSARAAVGVSSQNDEVAQGVSIMWDPTATVSRQRRPSAVANGQRRPLWCRAPLRDIRPPAERRLPLGVGRHCALPT
jgi:hypothetical protein